MEGAIATGTLLRPSSAPGYAYIRLSSLVLYVINIFKELMLNSDILDFNFLPKYDFLNIKSKL